MLARRLVRRAAWAFGAGVAGLGAYAIFVLPFAFPPSTAARSSAYAAGFNNRVAALAAILLSVLVAGVAVRFGRSNKAEEIHDGLTGTWLLSGLAVIVIWTALLGSAVSRAQINYGEAEYFLTQIQKGIDLHLPIYRGFQFAYGPLLYWWPALCIRLLGGLRVGLLGGVIPAYTLSLSAMQAAGVALCFYSVNALPISYRLRAFAFSYLVLGSISPTMGLNYSIFRFIVPVAAMALLARQRRLSRAVLAAALLCLGGLLVSSEIGVATVAGCIVWSIDRARGGGPRWLLPALGGVAAAALFLLAIGPEYLLILRRAGAGGFDLLLTPEPRTILLLVAVIGLAPLGVARAVRQCSPHAGLLLAIYGATLALLPVALGRCDSGHEFFFGLGAILLSLVAIDEARGPWPKLWIGCVVAIVLMAERADFHLYAPSLRLLRQAALHPSASTEPFDEARLEALLGGRRVAVVDDVPWPVQQALLARHLIAPGFYCELSSVWVAEAEQRKIAEMRGAGFALAPADGMADPADFNDGAIGRWRTLGLIYHQRRQPYVPGVLIDEELRLNWTPVAEMDGFELYRRVR